MSHIPSIGVLAALLLGTAPPARAQEAPGADCVAAGMLIILGAGSQASPEGVQHWVSVSNPTMRSVRVLHGPAGSGTTTQVEQGRTVRLPLGLAAAESGAPAPASADILRGVTLRCRPG